MNDLIFDLQRFDEVTIPAGDTYALDGVTYTALEDAQLNLGDDGKVSGLASGSVTATVTNKKDSAIVTFDAADGAINFSATGDTTFNLTLANRTFKFSKGDVTVTSQSVTVNAARFSVAGTYSAADYEFVVDESATFFISTDSFTITSEKISVIISAGSSQFEIQLSGTATRNFTNHTFSFTDGTTISTSLGKYILGVTAKDELGGRVSLTSNGIAFTPANNTGALAVSILRSGIPVIENELSITGGSIFLNPANQTVGVTKGTTIQLGMGNKELEIEITALDDASGKLTLTSDGGISFAPNAGDGSLKISVTRDGVTRTATLDVTGAITLGGDGSLTLAKGTVVRNVFEDGNILTITAKSDASGSVIFTPNNGLDITPATPEALDILLSRDGADIIEISGIKGSVNYKGGGFTASDGTTIHFVDPAGYYNDNELITSGGTTTVHFGENEIDYTPGENATFTMDYLQGTTWKLQNGTLTDYFAGPVQGMITLSEGSIFDTNDNEFSFALEKAGTYTLNGMNIATTKDNTEVTLNNYDTVTFAADAPVKVSTVEGGKLFMPAQDESDGMIKVSTKEYGNFKVTNGAITFDPATRKYSCTAGTTVAFTQGGQVLTFTADKDISATYKVEEDVYYFMLDDGATSNLSISSGGQTIFAGGLEFGGVLSYRPSTGTFGLTGANSSHGDGTNTFVNLTLKEQTSGSTYNLRAATHDTTVVFVPTLVDGKLEFNFPNANKHALNLIFSKDGQPLINNDLTIDGKIGLDIAAREVYMTKGTTIDVNAGDFSATFAANDDASVKLTVDNGKIKITPKDGDGSIDFAIKRGDQITFAGNLSISGGSIVFDPAAQTIGLTKGTTLTLTQDNNIMTITALDDASGQLSFVDGGIRFAPNAGDGALELNFVTAGRKATLDVTGAVVYGGDGKISLEDGTVVDITWTDGTNLKMTSHGSEGSIALDAQRGLKITSDDENLDIALTTPAGVKTNISGIKGTIYYNAGTTSFDDNSTITATTTLGGQPILTTLETLGGTGHISFVDNGTVYAADTGAMRITWSRDGRESTFTLNSGTIHIGHGIFEIAEGSDLSTDLKDFVPALYFTTSEAGTYTVNGRKVTTSTANIPITATDDYMAFNLNGAEISVDDLTFTGRGDVKIAAEAVTVGNGVEVAGLGKGNSFVLTEAGNVTVDNRVFELLEDVPTGITVTGDSYGFEFSRTLTKESEERLGFYNSPDIGKVFTERFSSKRDDSYRVQTDLLGLQQIIGISAPVTVTASAALDDEEIYSVFDVVTETDGKFKIGDKPYTISGDSSVTITARFDDGKASVRAFNDLNGTVSGDFTAHPVSINGGDPIIIHGDRDINIAVDKNGSEIFNLSRGSTLEALGGVSKVHTDTAGKFQFGNTEEDSLGVTIRGDDNVTFNFDSDQELTGISDLEGDIIFSYTSDKLTINGTGVTINGDISSVGAYDGFLYLHDATDATAINTKALDKTWAQMRGASMALNGNRFTLAEDDDGIWIRNKEVVGLDEGASLTVSEAGSYVVNGETLTLGADDVVVGLGDAGAYVYDTANLLVTRKTTAAELIDKFKPENVFTAGAGEVGNFSMSGGDLAVVEGAAARVNITAGDDTVVSQGRNVHVTLTGGNTWLFATGGKMTLDGYDATTGTGFGTNYLDIAAAVGGGAISFDEGALSIGSAAVDLGTRNEIVNFFDRGGTGQAVGFASHNAELDASDWTQDLILVGDTFSTLRGGTGDDTIFAAEGSFVDGGDGSNVIKLPETRNGYAGATINIINGRNTIENFSAGFDVTNDLIQNSSKYWDNVFDGKNVSIKTDNGTTILKDIGNGEAFVKFQESANGYNYKVALAQKNSVIAADEELANVYIGENSGVDFTGVEKPLFADLRNNNGQDIYFYGINNVTAGDGSATIIGSAKDETLTAGTAKNSIWGGAGNDLLRGNTSDDKGGSTEFFFMAGDGKDTISDFEFYDGSNFMTADKINVGTDEVTSVNVNGAGNVLLQLNNGDDWLTLSDAQGKDFRINDLIAKVDTTALAFDDAANCFVATGNNATLTVDEHAAIWLDGTHGTYYLGDIRTLDASKSAGENILAGNALDNTILAGDGNASLWGGDSGNDMLIGGAGKDMFFYAYGNGDDSISGATDGDIVNLAGVTLAEIASTEIAQGSVTINFADGGRLNVEGSAAVEFALNGEKYLADRASNTWIRK